MLYESIKKLVQYGINTGLTPETERIYTTNLLLDLLREDNYEDVSCDLDNIVLEDVLKDRGEPSSWRFHEPRCTS